MLAIPDEWPGADARRTRHRHILYVAFLLRQKLDHNLVPGILERAGLSHTFQLAWPQPTSRLMVVDQPPRPHHGVSDSPCQILLTPPITSFCRHGNPVLSVTVKVKSCDQGWTSNPDAGNWTWFSARILKALEQPRRSSRLRNRRISNPGRDKREHNLFKSAPELTDRLLFHNKMAEGESAWKRRELRADSADPEEAAWVRGLAVGDRIVVGAWARFPGWINWVNDAEIEIKTLACTR